MNIGIYIYQDAEVLDFAGPFEVLSTAARLANNNWNVFLIAQASGTVEARGGFPIQPHHTIGSHPTLDVLIVAGGIHAQEVKKPQVISWLSRTADNTTIVASVCTGAFLLAEAGLLDGLNVTSHWEDLSDLQDNYPQLTVIGDQRWIKQGKYITSAGISAGIDMTLELVSQLSDMPLAQATAKQMDYAWQQH